MEIGKIASERNLAISSGLANLLLCPFGAMPMCHGAGGLQAQYAPSMYVGLWSRLAGLTRDDLTNALVDRSVVRHRVHPHDLEDPQPQRVEHGGVDLAERTVRERGDHVVEREAALDASVCELLCESSLASLEPRPARLGAQHAVRVGAVGDAPQDAVSGRARGRSSPGIRCAAAPGRAARAGRHQRPRASRAR